MFRLRITKSYGLEIWADIDTYKGYYQVSTLGKIRSLDRVLCDGRFYKGGIKTPSLESKGYLRIELMKNGLAKKHRINVLVANAFLPNPLNLPQVNHKNEIKTDNTVDNLEWCDSSYNNNYGLRNSRVSQALSKPILQYSLDGSFVKKWDNAKDAASFYGVSHTAIQKVCRGIHKKCKGYIWVYAS